MEIGDVEETVSTDPEIDEGGLNGGLNVDHGSEIDVSDMQVFRGVFEVELFENPVFEDCDSAFLTLDVINDNLLFLLFFHRARVLSGFRAQSNGRCRRRQDRECFASECSAALADGEIRLRFSNRIESSSFMGRPLSK